MLLRAMRPLMISAVLCLVAVSAVAQRTINGRLQSGDMNRGYLLHVPALYDGEEAVPLVIVFHGSRWTSEWMERETGFSRVSDEEGFLVVYPRGYDYQWNDWRGLPTWPTQREEVDDIQFTRDLIAHLAERYQIDSQRIYATGHANGGLMTHLVGNQLSERFAAIAPITRALTKKIADTSIASRMPVLMVLGTNDGSSPWTGGLQRVAGQEIPVLSVAETVGHYTELNGCTGDPVEFRLPPEITRNGLGLLRTEYVEGCAGAVLYYTIEGGVHTLPQWNLDTARVIWGFFSGHARR